MSGACIVERKEPTIRSEVLGRKSGCFRCGGLFEVERYRRRSCRARGDLEVEAEEVGCVLSAVPVAIDLVWGMDLTRILSWPIPDRSRKFRACTERNALRHLALFSIRHRWLLEAP